METSKIGIVGGGQLGRMLTEAAKPLGYDVLVLDPTTRSTVGGDVVPHSPALQVGAEQIVANLDDGDAIAELAEHSDVVTWEIEHINTEALIELHAAGHNIQPSPEALRVNQDKYEQKDLLHRMGIPVADFYPLANPEDLEIIKRKWPQAIVKTRTGGYDGRGNLILNGESWEQISNYFTTVSSEESGLYVEEAIDFIKELSVIVAQDIEGQAVAFPVVETIHENNICDLVLSPAPIDMALREQAQDLAREAIACFGGAGVFAVEMFLDKDHRLFVNEIAPRVHNSGHHTIEANSTSQFEQHIRAITGAKLGSVDLISPAAMANILFGPITPKGINNVLATPNSHLHLYGKEPRNYMPRKIGHITSLAATVEDAKELAIRARRELSI